MKFLEFDDDNGWAYAYLAMISAHEGDEDEFFRNLEIAILKPEAYPLNEQMENEETFHRFRGDPRFKKILERSLEKSSA